MNALEKAIAAARAGGEAEARWFLAKAQREAATPTLRERIAAAFAEALGRFRADGERGAGDTLARIVKPVGDAIAAVKGSPCGGCGERQAALNEANPYKPA